MKKLSKFKISDMVRSKLELTMPLEIIRVKDEGSFYSYAVLDNYGKEHSIHESMLLAYKKGKSATPRLKPGA